MPVTYSASPTAPTLVLGHGAGAGQAHPWMTRVAKGLADRGVTVVTFNFPYIDAKRRVPDPAPKLEDAFRAVWLEIAANARGKIFAGGKSMGGRIASQAAARGLLDPSAAGLVFFGYPLHPPGKPTQRRDRHLSDIGAPMLFLHGERDPFGTPEEMRELIARFPGAQLEIIPEGDHSLVRPKRSDPRGASIDHALDVAAAWITR
jgi:predicted alpha/beta-hydrolase family hydrolase